jgi:hypothetical protein
LICPNGIPINADFSHFFNSAAERFNPFKVLILFKISAFLVSSPNIKKTLPSFVNVINIDLSGAALAEIELGGETVSTSGGFCFVAKMKKDNNKNATSHIAVMSIIVLFRGIFTLGMMKIIFDLL